MAEGTPKANRALALIQELVDAGRPIIYIQSPEEDRVAQLLGEAAQQLFAAPAPVFTWSLTEGLHRADGGAVHADGKGPRAVLDFIAAHPGAAVFHLKDFHEPMQASAEVRRRLRDLYAACLDAKKFVFISSPIRYVPDELSGDLV